MLKLILDRAKVPQPLISVGGQFQLLDWRLEVLNLCHLLW